MKGAIRHSRQRSRLATAVMDGIYPGVVLASSKGRRVKVLKLSSSQVRQVLVQDLSTGERWWADYRFYTPEPIEQQEAML